MRAVDLAFFETPSEWMDYARCVDQWRTFDGGDVDEARAICARCPVRMRCAEHAIKIQARTGVWAGVEVGRGGTRERLAELIALTGKSIPAGPHERPLHPIVHGTPAGYRAHRRRGEAACTRCVEAHREYERERPARRRESPRDHRAQVAS